MPPPAAVPPSPTNASFGAIFWDFLKVSLLGFGGGIALAHRYAVEQRQWLSNTEFTDALTLCQFMPGPNVVGIAICIGAKTRGLAGAITAFAGFALLPGIFGFTLALLYLGQTRVPVIQNTLSGLSAAAAGLLLGTGLRFLTAHWRDARTVSIAALAFAALAIAKLPLLLVLAALAPLSVAATVIFGVRPR
jgi:chromate transporter